jgi:hypothetical protein
MNRQNTHVGKKKHRYSSELKEAKSKGEAKVAAF